MIRYNFKTAYRNALKNKKISVFNVFGLSIGLACTIILLSWVTYEFSFDSFYKNKENIYRVIFAGEVNKEEINACWSPQGIGPEALAVMPEVKNFTRIRKQSRAPFKVGENQFYIDEGFAADSTFFSVFSLMSKIGNLSKSLNRKDLVVIDEYLAEKCFGNDNPIGKIIDISNHNYTVSAVIKNVQENSHLRFHYLIPVLNLPESWQQNQWSSDNCIQYLLFRNGIDNAEIGNKLTAMVHEKNNIWKQFNVSIKLQPLSKIHFDNTITHDTAIKGNIQNVYVLVSVAFLILLIACVNFTNMFISTSLKRTRSIGVKIVAGATRQMIIKEFMFGVLIFVVVSFLISVVVAKLSLPYFNRLFDTHLEIQFLRLNFLLISAFLLVLTLLLAGVFPGIYLTRFNPVTVLKAGSSKLAGKKSSTQQGLVVLQFVIATILIVSVIVMQKQVSLFRTKQLGFDKENIVYVHSVGEFNNIQNLRLLKEQLLKDSNIEGIVAQSSLPNVFEVGGNIYTSKNPDKLVHGEMVGVSEDYFDVMKIDFLEGEQDFNYSNEVILNCVINETAARQLQLKPPYTGQTVFSYNQDRYLNITGVIKDINTKSLAQEVKPCLYTKANFYTDNGVILYRISGNYEAAIQSIRDYCTEYNATIPFEFQFLDETYNGLYKSEIRTQKILSWFSILSVLLTSMGLLAMVYFITENKTKEIGIRKVNGAKVSEILSMLNKDFIKWVAIAFVIACPIAWYAMSKWLENFAYKTTLSWWIFALTGILALGIALLTVSWQSWRAATRNPVEALRYE
nr:ABC transporter permease [uncultured Draconibacterium sp.]